MARVTLRTLSELDLSRLHSWLNEPHLFPFYMQDSYSQEDVVGKFRPRLESDHPCHSLIAETETGAFGYIQWYLNRSFPDYGIALLDEPLGVSIDYFIGSPGHLGRGLGPAMLEALVDQVTPNLAPQDRRFHIGHDIRNERAIACTRRARFQATKDFVEQGLKHRLYVRDVARPS